VNGTVRRVRISRLRVLAVMTGIAALLLVPGTWSRVGASTSSRVVGSTESATPQVRLSSYRWIFYKEDFNHIRAKNPALIKQILAGPGTYVLERRRGGPPLPARVVPVQIFYSQYGLQRTINKNRIIPGVELVSDDLESWTITPKEERHDPMAAMEGFAQTAHDNGLRPILVPGRDLMRVPKAVCTQQPHFTISQAYLTCGLPAAAEFAPVFVIQASAVETDLTALTQLVKEGSSQARKANPKVMVFATLSVSPNGATVGYGAVVKAAQTIAPYVDGFSMNNIRPSDPRMIGFLQALSQASSS
jgi:hypothetical protein